MSIADRISRINRCPHRHPGCCPGAADRAECRLGLYDARPTLSDCLACTKAQGDTGRPKPPQANRRGS